MDDYKTLRNMVLEMLNTEDRGFSEWEIDFLDGMKKQSAFTPKQAAAIEAVYRQKMQCKFMRDKIWIGFSR
ncbi:MAG TPA: hypothetical protein PKB02_10695 [Anaerohalosphaeraceae bacterium]|nr:hypothetical protein [Anaerohalosphaeraceae bacterium]